MNGQKALKQIALIKTGCTVEQIKPRHGDFENWFAEGMGVSELLQVDVFKHQPLPDIKDLSGIVISGSAAMVSDRQDWSERTADWLAKVVPTGLPILGVCYGHQLLAQALGGRAGRNPNGRQIGTVTTELIDNKQNDLLIGRLPVKFPAQASHSEVVLELPTGAERLATSPLDKNFAIRFTENVWGVQFHPEFSAPVMSEYIHYRAKDLRKEGLSPADLQKKVRNTEEANSVLQKFLDICEAVEGQ